MSVGRTVRRWRPAGLRMRLALALVATSVATLLAATATMAPLLRQRLESDRLADLRSLARTVRPQLRVVPDADLQPHSRKLLGIAEKLERRVGGRIAIFDAANRELVDTSSLGAEPVLTDLAAQQQRALARRDHVTSGRHDGRAFALVISREEAGRLTLVITKRLNDTRAAEAVVQRVLPLGLLAGLLVGVLLAALLSRSVLRRLARLHGDAQALGDEGLRHEVAVDGHDEVTVVARALEAMRARLIEEEVSRQAFVATASHELRTPLASLQATLELLREEVLAGRAAPATTAERADTALRQTHRLIGLATDLLDLSRVDGEAELHPEPLELAELARTVAPEFAARLGEARPVTVEGGPALVVADPAATARVLRILLDNACNYGAGAVRVSVRTEAEEIVLTVTDEGPGFAAEEREAVFGRFARGSASPGTPGAGLGLPIARALAQAQDGTLTSVAAERGARLVLTLPPWRGEP